MSQCLNNAAVIGCYSDGTNAPVSVVIHYSYDNEGQPAVHITDLAGAVVAGATLANTTVGQCAMIPPDVEWEELCDVQANGSSTPFMRRTITTFDGLGAPTVAVADFALDQVTAYTLTGTAGSCPTCAELPARGLQTAW
jgi:hypothetical protein